MLAAPCPDANNRYHGRLRKSAAWADLDECGAVGLNHLRSNSFYVAQSLGALRARFGDGNQSAVGQNAEGRHALSLGFTQTPSAKCCNKACALAGGGQGHGRAARRFAAAAFAGLFAASIVLAELGADLR